MKRCATKCALCVVVHKRVTNATRVERVAARQPDYVARRQWVKTDGAVHQNAKKHLIRGLDGDNHNVCVQDESLVIYDEPEVMLEIFKHGLETAWIRVRAVENGLMIVRFDTIANVVALSPACVCNLRL